MKLRKIDCTVLIGLPGTGKSTYRTNFLKENTNYVVISTDDMIEEFAHKNNLTYNGAWDKLDLANLEKMAQIEVINAVADCKPILIDRTNMSKRSREKFLSLLSEDYKKTAIVFTATDKTINERRINREKEGKVIPITAIDYLRERYNEPCLDEFDEIVQISTESIPNGS